MQTLSLKSHLMALTLESSFKWNLLVLELCLMSQYKQIQVKLRTFTTHAQEEKKSVDSVIIYEHLRTLYDK